MQLRHIFYKQLMNRKFSGIFSVRTGEIQNVVGLLLSAMLVSAATGCHDRFDPRDVAPVPVAQQQQQLQSQITLVSDDWKLYAELSLPKDKPVGAVILLHQRGGSSADWLPLCKALNQAGIATLALDQRGAGKSVGPKGLTGDKAPWDTSSDIKAAVDYLNGQKFRGHIGIVGASYGANNALIYASASEHFNDIKAVSLLSPGANYNGLDAVAAAKMWHGPLQIIYSRNDTYAGLGPQQIRDATPSKDKVVSQYDDDKHGTDMLTGETIDSCVVFLSRTIN